MSKVKHSRHSPLLQGSVLVDSPKQRLLHISIPALPLKTPDVTRPEAPQTLVYLITPDPQDVLQPPTVFQEDHSSKIIYNH